MRRFVNSLNETQKYALIGIAFGFLFPIIAVTIRILAASLSFSLSSIAAVHSIDPLLWIIDTAPVFLGFFASLAGRRQDQVKDLIHQLRDRESEMLLQQQELEKRVDERTSRLSRKTEQLRSASYIARQTAEIQDLS